MATELRPHIGIFGRRNSGKSSIINYITRQDIAIVSNRAGTTTDPVRKSIEIFGIGPVVITDTAGIDDVGDLGQQRVAKTMQVLKEIDCAILVIADNVFGQTEMDLVERLNETAVPFFVVHNKSDIHPLDERFKNTVERSLNVSVMEFSTLWNSYREVLTLCLKNVIPASAYQKVSLLGGLVKSKDVVVLVCPIDAEAPDGRLILPEVMGIRDALNNDCLCITVKETNLEQCLQTVPKPALVVTDSQVFDYVSKIVPQDIPLTSFSILMARMKGNFENYTNGTPKLSELHDGDKVLILESCSHEVNCEDIGRVKLPDLIRSFSGKTLRFDYVAGLSPIKNIGQYAIVIQCGGCMVTRKQLINRISIAVNAGVPITNYGMAIAFMTGIFDRVMRPFRK